PILSSPADGRGPRHVPLCRSKWRRWAFYSTGGLILPQRHDERLMSGRAQEFDEVCALKPGGAGVDQRMKVEPFMAHHRFIQHDANLSGLVVDCAERRHRPGPHTPDL